MCVIGAAGRGWGKASMKAVWHKVREIELQSALRGLRKLERRRRKNWTELIHRCFAIHRDGRSKRRKEGKNATSLYISVWILSFHSSYSITRPLRRYWCKTDRGQIWIRDVTFVNIATISIILFDRAKYVDIGVTIIWWNTHTHTHLIIIILFREKIMPPPPFNQRAK